MVGRTPIVINETQEDPTWTVSGGSQIVHSWIGVPLISKGVVLGVVVAVVIGLIYTRE